MHVMADVSEEYLGTFNKGDFVSVEFPKHDQIYQSKVQSVGNILDDMNRTFKLEVNLPVSSGFKFRPNQVAILKIADYKKLEAVVIPSKIILSGKDGKFIYIVGEKDGKKVAIKRIVSLGKSTSEFAEVNSGLDGNEEIIIAGYREVSDGAEVRFKK